MPKAYPNLNNPKNHLSYLQRNSWEIELLVSAIALGLLWQTRKWVTEAIITMDPIGENGLALFGLLLPAGFLITALEILLFLFVIHFIFRSIWVATLGLSSVSKEPSLVNFQVSPFFGRWLNERVPSTSSYIAQLDKKASIHLSLAFLFFCTIMSIAAWLLLSLVFTFISLIAYTKIIDIFGSLSWQSLIFLSFWLIISVLFLICSLVYCIDFISAGWVKKKLPEKIYIRPYKILSTITFSRYYRYSYYSLISDKSGRKLFFIYLVIFFVYFVLLQDAKLHPKSFFPKNSTSVISVQPANYENTLHLQSFDQRMDNQDFPSVPNEYTQNGYLRIFIPYFPIEENYVKFLNPPGDTLPPPIHTKGVKFFWDSKANPTSSDLEIMLYLQKSANRLYLNDSLLQNVPWRFYEHPQRKQAGIVYQLPVHEIPRGEHILRFEQIDYLADLNLADTLPFRETAVIHFYH